MNSLVRIHNGLHAECRIYMVSNFKATDIHHLRERFHLDTKVPADKEYEVLLRDGMTIGELVNFAKYGNLE